MNLPTCATCQHFRELYGEKAGWCWGVPPPLENVSGFAPRNPPRVKINRPACGLYLELPTGVETVQHAKASPETPHDAAKQAAQLAANAPVTSQNAISTERPALGMAKPTPADKAYMGPGPFGGSVATTAPKPQRRK